MRFKIPANTEIEDKILPFLSVRQLIILCVGGTIGYGVFHILFSIGYIPAVWGFAELIIIGITLAAAFLKINHLEFHRWIALLISKIFVPQKRFFNNGLIGSQNFDVLNISNSEEEYKKRNQLIEKKSVEKNNLDQIKNEIFGVSEKNDFNDFDLEFDEIDDFKKRFG